MPSQREIHRYLDVAHTVAPCPVHNGIDRVKWKGHTSTLQRIKKTAECARSIEAPAYPRKAG